MKKILSITAVALALSSLSVQADLLKVEHEHNWKKTSDSGYANSPKSTEVEQKTGEYADALKSAKAEAKKAKKAGMLWNTIGGKKGLLAKAKKLHKKGDVKGAVKLLETAKAHGILGQKQAKDQANAGPNF